MSCIINEGEMGILYISLLPYVSTQKLFYGFLQNLIFELCKYNGPFRFSITPAFVKQTVYFFFETAIRIKINAIKRKKSFIPKLNEL